MTRPGRRGRGALSRANSSTPLSPARNSMCNNDKTQPRQGLVGPKPTKNKIHATRGTGRRAITQKHASNNNNSGHQATLNKQNTKKPIKRGRKTPHTAETETDQQGTENATHEEKPKRRRAGKKNCAKKDLTSREQRKRKKHKKMTTYDKG